MITTIFIFGIWAIFGMCLAGIIPQRVANKATVLEAVSILFICGPVVWAYAIYCWFFK